VLDSVSLKQDAMLSQRWPRDAPYSLYGWSENRL